MFSLENEVLARHLPLFVEKSVLFFGYVRDDFAQSLTDAKSVSVLLIRLVAVVCTILSCKTCQLSMQKNSGKATYSTI